MKSIFRKYDNYFLERLPIFWVIGLHIFLPLVFLITVVLFTIGLPNVLGISGDESGVEKLFERVGLTMILPVILLVILFIRRQVRFNNIRVHQKLPFKRRFRTFILFWVILFSIVSLPFVIRMTALFHPDIVRSETEFKQDLNAINLGFVHFRFLAKLDDDGIDYRYDSEIGQYYPLTRYFLDDSSNQLILSRQFYQYESYSNINVNDTISVDSALSEINNLIHVAEKYGAMFDNKDARDILKGNLDYVSSDFGSMIYQLDSDYETSNTSESYNRIRNKDHLEFKIHLNNMYHEQSGIFTFNSFKFWQYYSLLPFGLAYLLIILCSVTRKEFGWAMLVTALVPTVFGISYAMLEMIGLDFDEQLLLIVFIVIMILIVFTEKFKPMVRRVFAISMNIFLPIVLPIVLEIRSDDSYFWFFVITGLGTTVLFSLYYRYHYIHPQK